MNKTLARILSVAAHPVFINLLCLAVLFGFYPPLNSGLPKRVQIFYVLFIFISTGILPLILVLFLRLSGKIQSIQLHEAGERKIPYLLTLAMYIFCYYNFAKSHATHPLILHYLLGCAAVVFVVYAINTFNKISIHMATLGALAGLLSALGSMGFADIRLLLIPAFVLSGWVGSARLSLLSHVPQQIYTGFVLGFVLMFLFMNLSYTFA